MPAFLEADLRAEAARKGLKGEAADHYVFGTMNRIGAMHGSAETPKGAAMQRKHDADHPLRAAAHAHIHQAR